MSNLSYILAPFNRALHLTTLRLTNPFNFYNWCFFSLLAFISHLPIDPAILPDTIVWVLGIYINKLFVFIKTSSLLGSIFMTISFITIFLAIGWLRYIGKFMFLIAILRGEGHLAQLWEQSYKKGTACFIVFCGLLLFSLLITGVLLAILILTNEVLQKLFSGGFLEELLIIYLALPIACCFWLMAIPFMVLKDFIIPMLENNIKIYDGAKIMLKLCKNYPFQLLGYLCIKIILWGGLFTLILTSGLITGGITLLPFIKILLFLPVYVLARLYPVCVLEHFGIIKIE